MCRQELVLRRAPDDRSRNCGREFAMCADQRTCGCESGLMEWAEAHIGECRWNMREEAGGKANE